MMLSKLLAYFLIKDSNKKIRQSLAERPPLSEEAIKQQAITFLSLLGGKENVVEATHLEKQLIVSVINENIVAPISAFKEAGAAFTGIHKEKKYFIRTDHEASPLLLAFNELLV